MASNREAKVLFTAETKQFTANIKQAKSSLSTLRSELKLNEANFKNSGDAVQFYTTKQNLLQQELEQSRTKIDNLRQKLEAAKRIYGEGSEEVQHWTRQLNGALTEQQRIESSLNQCERELQQYTNEQREASTALGKLNREINEQERELEQLKREYVNACLQFGRNSTEAKQLARQIDTLSEELNENRREVQRYEDAADELDNTMEDVEEEAEDMGDGFTVLKGVIANLVTEALQKLVQALKDVAKFTVSTGMSFEKEMSKVKALSGSNADEMEKLKNKAKEMGATTQFSASESAQAFQYMAMAGWKATDMVDGIKGIMDLAAASGTDLARTSDIVTDALTGFGLSAKDSAHFANVLATTSTSANTNVDLLGESFKYCAPVCGSLGYTAEDTAVALGLMANAGIKGSQAGTSLKTALANMAKPSKTMKEAMDQLGISLTDGHGKMYTLKEMMEQLRQKIGDVDVELVDADGQMRNYDDIINDLSKSHDGLSKVQKIQAAAAIFGKESMAGMLAIINESPKNYANLTDAIHKCDGAYDGMGSAAGTAQTMMDNLDGDITILKSTLEGVAVDAYEKFGEPLRGAVQSVKSTFERADIKKGLMDIAEAFGNVASKVVAKIPDMVEGLVDFAHWVKDNMGLIKTLGAVIATVFVATKILGFVSAIASAINPVTLVIAGIAALVAGFVHLWNTSESFRNFWIGLWEKIKAVMSPIIDIIKSGLLVAFRTLKSAIEPVKTAFSQVLDSLKPLESYFKLIGAAIGAVVTTLVGVVIGAITGLANALGGIVQMIEGILQFIASGFSMYFETIGAIWQTIKALFTGNTDQIKKIWSNWLDNMKNYLKTTWEGIKNIFGGAINFVFGLIAGFVRGIAEFFSGLYDTLVGHSIVPDMMNAIINVFMWLPNKVIAIVKAFVSGAISVFNSLKSRASSIFNSIKSFLSSVWNSIKSVVSKAVSNVYSTVTAKFNSVKSTVSSIFNSIKSTLSSIWNSIKSVISSVISSIYSTISSKFNSIKSTMSSVLNSAKNTVVSVFNSIKSSISNVMNSASNIVKNSINKIKSFFNFKVSLPKVKLPHFSVSGSKNPIDWIDKGTPKFSVSWYKQGGIFTKPTLFNTNSGLKGVGEAGAEAVLPIEKLQGFIDNALQNQTYDANLVNAIERLANREIQTNLYINDKLFATATAKASDYVDGNRLTFSARGVAVT